MWSIPLSYGVSKKGMYTAGVPCGLQHHRVHLPSVFGLNLLFSLGNDLAVRAERLRPLDCAVHIGVDSNALDRVAVGVEADGAGDRVDGQAGQRVADGGAVGGLGLFDGCDRGHVGVIAEGGDCRDNVVAAVVGEVLGIAVQPRLIAGDEFLSKTGLVVLVKERGDEDLHVGAVLRVGDRGVLPRVAAEDGEADAEGGSLQPLLENDKAAELTRNRVYELAEYLK